jgi:hypothetical protein
MAIPIISLRWDFWRRDGISRAKKRALHPILQRLSVCALPLTIATPHASPECFVS